MESKQRKGSNYMAVKMTADEKRWRAEDDARTLKRYAEMQNDPSRLKEASKIIDKELNSLSRVKTLTGAKSTKKTASTAKKTAPKKQTAKKAPKKTTKKGSKK